MTNEELIAWQRREQSPIEKALRRAYQLGQTYWQQADSDSYKLNRLSDETRQKFEELVAESIAAAPQAPSGQQAEPMSEGAIVQAALAHNVSSDYAAFRAGVRFAEKALAGQQSERRPAPVGQNSPFNAVARALELSSLHAGSVGMNDREGADHYRNELRSHLMTFMYPFEPEALAGAPAGQAVGERIDAAAEALSKVLAFVKMPAYEDEVSRALAGLRALQSLAASQAERPAGD
ncbi:hypothetical protein H4CHR_02953 [Variovorax sp. PBS-H4]|uniref:hypothetical protein n=1 Tax=Variovorax sp. PBS-H4 TaxID=434008 RepID=UPI001315F1FB|nr:hypothetical protein [Variovorax sp. PBS-H4]VTU32150.1 hypothetical protein H4CHR_02953 [Variovorax sp. PBS-H4]